MTDFLTPIEAENLEPHDEFPHGHPGLDVPEETQHPAPAEPGSTPARKPKAKAPRAKVTAAIVRRVLDTHTSVEGYEDEHRRLLAAALGTGRGTADITVGLLTGGRYPLAAVGELLGIANADSPFKAMVTALSLERADANRVWMLLTELGAAEGTLSAKTELAGAAIAEAASALTAEQRDLLTSFEELVD